MYKLKRSFYIIIGSIVLSLAIIGIFLPVIPTTPLIMASCYCYSKGSRRFYNWLVATSFYKLHAKDFIENKQLPLKKKIGLLAFASTMLLFPLFILEGFLKLLIIGIYLYLYYYFIFKIKTTYHTLEETSC